MTNLFLKDFTKDNLIYSAKEIINASTNGLEHDHDFYEIFFIESGQLDYTINNEHYVLKEGHIQLVLPQNRHLVKCQGTNFCVLNNIAFSSDLLSSVDLEQIQFHIRGTYIPIIRYNTNAFDMLHTYFSHLHQTQDTVLKTQLLETILKNYFMTIILEQHTSTNDSVPIWLRDTVTYLETLPNFTKPISEIIDYSGKTQEYLCRMMKQYYQMSPTEYMNMLRLEYVASLLKKTPKSITTIMLDAGFGNVSYFNRLFKQKYACTPSQYRKQYDQIFMQY